MVLQSKRSLARRYHPTKTGCSWSCDWRKWEKESVPKSDGWMCGCAQWYVVGAGFHARVGEWHAERSALMDMRKHEVFRQKGQRLIRQSGAVLSHRTNTPLYRYYFGNEGCNSCRWDARSRSSNGWGRAWQFLDEQVSMSSLVSEQASVAN